MRLSSPQNIQADLIIVNVINKREIDTILKGC